jgi:VWFA-related protein
MHPLAASILLAGAVTGAAAPLLCRASGPMDDPAPQRDPRTRIVVDVNRVDVLFAVTDKRGRFITGLNKDQFEVLEDDRPQKVLGFAAGTELPLRLAVALDSSNSVRNRFRFIQEAAVEFITGTVRPRLDRAVVMSFDTNVEQVAELSDDPQKLAKAIRELRPGGGTSFYDAIYLACRERLSQTEPGQSQRRAIVVLTDGEDNQSHSTRDQALAAAQNTGVVIYAVSTNESRVETHGDRVLKYLAQETGGLAFFPFRLEDLGRSFSQLANELRNQYSIVYRPEPMKSDGKYHTVTVRVKGRKDAVVRARKGYYAPRP